jgi:predicted Rossmann-fold nucleotide-binding protein
LYRRVDLFDGWTTIDPHSYASTFDARTYLAAVRSGLRAPKHDHTAHDRATHDTAVSRLLHDQLVRSGRRPVAIMGGHALARTSPVYAAAAEIAGGLSRAGLSVLTGGGPGAMEAAHLGARLFDRDRIVDGLAEIGRDREALEFPDEAARILGHTGRDFDLDALSVLHRWQRPAFALAEDTDAVSNETIGIPTWLYGHEPPTPLATSHAKYFENSLREDGLLALATYGVVFLPGRAGTIQEIFQDAAQNAYRTVQRTFSPMVFFDLDGYWTERYPVRAVLEALFDPDDLHRVLWSTDRDEIVDFIDAFEPPSPV